MSLRSLASAGAHPVRSTTRLVARTSPELLWKRYERLCRRAGFSEPAFILSLDCDTSQDIEVAVQVHDRLTAVGICPVYAVPGELLEEGSDVYLKLASSGATFMNHGYARHTTYDPANRTYTSFFFYDQQDRATVAKDIAEGHEVVTRVLGRAPSGFRTPHFASFQKGRQLGWLHGVLFDLGYRYSSSTIPLQAIRRGPAIRGPVWEVPVTGTYDAPLTILDSWSFRFDRTSTKTTRDYEQQATRLAGMLDRGMPIMINLYADPSQVWDWDGFFDVMSLFAAHAVDSYDALLDGLHA